MRIRLKRTIASMISQTASTIRTTPTPSSSTLPFS
jgi:hypothetical protein